MKMAAAAVFAVKLLLKPLLLAAVVVFFSTTFLAQLYYPIHKVILGIIASHYCYCFSIFSSPHSPYCQRKLWC